LSSVEKAIEVVGALRFKVPDKTRNILRVSNSYEKVHMVSLNNETDESNGVEFLGAGKCGADQNVHESQRDKGKALLGSKSNEVYPSGYEKSWIAHGWIIGERRRELLARSLAPGNLPGNLVDGVAAK
jgi:hypothetical protein